MRVYHSAFLPANPTGEIVSDVTRITMSMGEGCLNYPNGVYLIVSAHYPGPSRNDYRVVKVEVDYLDKNTRDEIAKSVCPIGFNTEYLVIVDHDLKIPDMGRNCECRFTYRIMDYIQVDSVIISHAVSTTSLSGKSNSMYGTLSKMEECLMFSSDKIHIIQNAMEATNIDLSCLDTQTDVSWSMLKIDVNDIPRLLKACHILYRDPFQEGVDVVIRRNHEADN